jgi:hypothetical protein
VAQLAKVSNIHKLGAHNVHIMDPKNTLPVALEAYIENIIEVVRVTTPSALRISQKASLATKLYEQTAANKLRANALSEGKADGGERYVKSGTNLNLVRQSFPHAETSVSRKISPLSQARPDTILGYIPSIHARSSNVPAPL